LIDPIIMNSKRLGGAKMIYARERAPSAFAGIVWLDKFHMADTAGEFEKRHDRWITLATLQATKCPFRNFLNRVNRLDSKEVT
jgi:hypothetical protein